MFVFIAGGQKFSREFRKTEILFFRRQNLDPGVPAWNLDDFFFFSDVRLNRYYGRLGRGGDVGCAYAQTTFFAGR